MVIILRYRGRNKNIIPHVSGVLQGMEVIGLEAVQKLHEAGVTLIEISDLEELVKEYARPDILPPELRQVILDNFQMEEVRPMRGSKNQIPDRGLDAD